MKSSGGYGSLLRTQSGLFPLMLATRVYALPFEHPHSCDAVECAVDRVFCDIFPCCKGGKSKGCLLLALQIWIEHLRLGLGRVSSRVISIDLVFVSWCGDGHPIGEEHFILCFVPTPFMHAQSNLVHGRATVGDCGRRRP